MPLPFSFSTQRQIPEVEPSVEASAMALSEKVMNQAPGHVSTEPLLLTAGSAFVAPALEIMPRAIPTHPRQSRPHQSHFSDPPEAVLTTDFQAATLQPSPLPPQSSNKPAAAAAGGDWAAQIEQLRNDIFGIAMNVSALNDRLDRMEQRLPQAGQSVQTSIATLRGEIETWLENHLNGAVEHCMHKIISRTNSPAPQTVN